MPLIDNSPSFTSRCLIGAALVVKDVGANGAAVVVGLAVTGASIGFTDTGDDVEATGSAVLVVGQGGFDPPLPESVGSGTKPVTVWAKLSVLTLSKASCNLPWRISKARNSKNCCVISIPSWFTIVIEYRTSSEQESVLSTNVGQSIAEASWLVIEESAQGQRQQHAHQKTTTPPLGQLLD
jgi:hypothetical protein